MKKIAKQVRREANQIKHDFEALPEDSNERPKLLKALELRTAAIELNVRLTCITQASR
jgi:hypothetical protein